MTHVRCEMKNLIEKIKSTLLAIFVIVVGLIILLANVALILYLLKAVLSL